MEANMAGDDASIDAAVAAITKKISPADVGLAAPKERQDARQNRVDRDPIEMDDYHDLNDLEAAERVEREAGKQAQPEGDAEGEEGTEASADDDAFIEIAAAEEGGEPERIPAKEAADAFKQLRQMNGDIASAVIKAEEEAFAKQDQITQSMANTLSQIERHAQAQLQMMKLYAPQVPHPEDFYTTEEFYKAKLHYDQYNAHYQRVLGQIAEVKQGRQIIGGQEDSEYARREIERTARFIPEFKQAESREAYKASMLEQLKHYGVTKAELDEITDHKAWRMISDLARLKAAETKAPEVRKQIKEKVAKVTNGRLPEREKATGRFIGDARKELRERGDEASLANWLLKSGALKGL